MKTTSFAQTDVGLRREHNEDAYLVDEELGLYAVADGMGGHAAGEVASAEAVETVRDTLLSQIHVYNDFEADPNNDNADALRRVMEQSIRLAAYQVFGMSEIDPSRKGMGTTMSAMLLRPAATFIAHVGDSRIYMLRGDRTALVTQDHTYVAAMVASGKMTAEQASKSKYSNVLLRAVGSKDYVEVETRMLRHETGDIFLLCSDGMHGYFRQDDVSRLVDSADLDGSMQRLIKLALDRGGKDNITGILLRVDE